MVRLFATAWITSKAFSSTYSRFAWCIYFQNESLIALQRSALAAPCAFVGPRMWLQYSGTLKSLLTTDLTNHNPELPPTARELASHVLSDITIRNESLLFQNLPPRVLASVGSAVSDAQLLNSICASTNMETISFLEVHGEGQLDGEASGRFASKLDTLLTWSVTRLQYGDHRTYAAVTIISRWYERMVERAARRLAKCSPREALQDHLFDWLDSSAAAAEDENLPAIARLFGELVEKGLFSYSAYIERLIARGEKGLSFSMVCAYDSVACLSANVSTRNQAPAIALS